MFIEPDALNSDGMQNCLSNFNHKSERKPSYPKTVPLFDELWSVHEAARWLCAA